MKTSSILINVGRGGIVDEKALADALNKKMIGGACIDVFPKEPISAENPLLQLSYPDKLLLTPHNAWASVEARTKLLDIVYKNIADFIEGALQ
jgi:glycerate dehydrogenase